MRLMRMTMSLVLLSLSFSVFAKSQQNLECLAGERVQGQSQRQLSISNEQVLHWKESTPNKFEARALIKGYITAFYPDRNGHDHFQIQIGPHKEDTIEVVYNQHFGAIKTMSIGDTVEACGDYITAIAQSGPYPPSPDGAIIHWIHYNPPTGYWAKHQSGYLKINGRVCGQNVDC